MITKSKRGQGEIITTVLIVLVVLAAIAIVAAFIMRNVKTSTETAENKTAAQAAALAVIADCANVDLEVTNQTRGTALTNMSTVTVKNAGGSITLTDVIIYVDGKSCSTTAQSIAPGKTATYNIVWNVTGQCITGETTPSPGNGKLEVAAKILTNVCPVDTSKYKI